jgi:hypothetical protein
VSRLLRSRCQLVQSLGFRRSLEQWLGQELSTQTIRSRAAPLEIAILVLAITSFDLAAQGKDENRVDFRDVPI